MNPALRMLKPYPMVELQRRKQKLREAGGELFDFGTGDPVEPTPPAIRQALIDAIPEVSQYPTVAGTPALRQAIAAYLQRRFNVSLDPDSAVIPSAGSKEAIFHLPLAFLDPSSSKDTVIYGTPGYPVYEAGTLFAGGRCHPVVLRAESGFRLDLAGLPAELLDRSAIAWINYPHNPTGVGVDRAYLASQAAIAQKHGILLVADECYTDLWFDADAPAPPSLLEIGQEGLLIVHSCSKRSGMTGYRSGFIAGDPRLVTEYRRWRAAMGVGSPAFVEAAATAAWSDDQHVQERRRTFAAKYQLLRDGLQLRGHQVWESPAGLYLWASVPGGMTSAAWAQRCLDAGIVISPGDFFGEGGEGWFRLALVPGLADCQRALERWPQS
ncbi:MAG: succinyldiaminopimelate transaminase [Planctomycetota bacterium]|nr:MAG: succinyldiaminopimelate transaminase [Planctomycetota bacterium]